MTGLKEAFRQFGIGEEDVLKSLSPNAEVHQIKACGRQAVLKKTRSPILHARSLGQWLRQCQAASVPVVAPLELGSDNPVLMGDHCAILPGRLPSNEEWASFLKGIEDLGLQWGKEEKELVSLALGHVFYGRSHVSSDFR